MDDLVLDVKEFINHHPGGRFVIRKTVGTDIGKFFFGGYSIENNSQRKIAKGHTHSNYAALIAN